MQSEPDTEATSLSAMENGQTMAPEARSLIVSIHDDSGGYSAMTFSLVVSTIVAQCSAMADGCAVSFLTPMQLCLIYLLVF